MSTNTCETLRNVKKGRTDWKIKCRVIREWRGVSTTGEIFKGWNLLLLDSKVLSSIVIINCLRVG